MFHIKYKRQNKRDRKSIISIIKSFVASVQQSDAAEPDREDCKKDITMI